MSLAALNWYVEQILDSNAEATWFYVVHLRSDTGVGEDTTETFSVSRNIAAALLPVHRINEIDGLASKIQEEVPMADLCELEKHLSALEGQLFLSAIKAKSATEDFAIGEFETQFRHSESLIGT
jgi:hypothetical protein